MKKDFKTPMSSIAGSNFFNFRKVAKKYKIEKNHRAKFYKSITTSAFVTLLSVFDKIRYQSLKKSFKADDAPIFILGHWRSGTTLLHKLMCLDTKAGYTTTYHTVFPHNLFGLQGLLKRIMLLIMPTRRPHDGLEIHPDYPQEEEFALANTTSLSYYHWFYFAKNRKEIFKTLNNWQDLPPQKKKSWFSTYDDLVRRSLINTDKKRYVSKNPPNTFRIPQLLALYPNAKFIYIYRNPYEVYPSSFSFFKSVIKNIGFHDICDADIKEHVLTVFKELVNKYEKDKKLISEKNLIEIRYEDFIKSPAAHLENIYGHFDMEVTPFLKNAWELEEAKAKRHKINKTDFDKDLIAEINIFLEDYINEKGYALMQEKVS
ncbi:MAG: hypothetical protein DRQ88_09825 [Epsilonproteobacteria bacterium]|nr:MAG: hypothetical protein DRQ89_02575 [Campylobacterota bacterium]RLA65137.1 MAG: hypothetical protein DRQ88_09825 [Campylobacterota bacterium]